MPAPSLQRSTRTSDDEVKEAAALSEPANLSIMITPPEELPSLSVRQHEEHPGAVAAQLPFAAQMAVLRGTRAQDSPQVKAEDDDRPDTPQMHPRRRARQASGGTTPVKRERDGPFVRGAPGKVASNMWEEVEADVASKEEAPRRRVRPQKVASRTSNSGLVYTRTNSVLKQSLVEHKDFHILTPEASETEELVDYEDVSLQTATRQHAAVCAPFGDLPFFVTLTAGWRGCWSSELSKASKNQDQDEQGLAGCPRVWTPCEAEKSALTRM